MTAEKLHKGHTPYNNGNPTFVEAVRRVLNAPPTPEQQAKKDASKATSKAKQQARQAERKSQQQPASNSLATKTTQPNSKSSYCWAVLSQLDCQWVRQGHSHVS